MTVRQLILAAFTASLAACSEAPRTPEGAPLDAQASPLPVSVVPVKPAPSYPQARTYTGEVRARRTTDLGFELRGRIAALAVDVGAQVKAGQELGRLDTRRSTARRAATAAQLQQAKERLAEMRAGPRRETIAAARAEVRRLEKQVRLNELQLGRKKKLLRDEVASQEDVDIAETRLETAQAELAGARSRLEELENGTRKEQIAAQEATVGGLTAQLESLDIDVRDAVLRAPFAGTIARRHLDPGVVVDIGDPVFRLVESARLEAWIGLPAGIPTTDATTKRRVEIRGVAYEVAPARVLPELDARTRTATLVFDLPAVAAKNGVQPGEVARLHVARDVATAGFWLPMSALSQSTRGMWSCFVLEDEGGSGAARPIRRAEVEVLHVTVDRAFVRGTLRAGDRVLTGGNQRVVPGQLVVPEDES